MAALLSWLNMTWFCSRSHIAGSVWCQLLLLCLVSGVGWESSHPLWTGEQCPWPWPFVAELTELCIFVLFSLCSALFLGEEVEEGNLQCVAHTSYSLYYKQILSLLHLNFCSMWYDQFFTSIKVSTCASKRVTG